MLISKMSGKNGKFSIALSESCKAVFAAEHGIANAQCFSMQAWQKYNSPALDFDLRFATDNLRQMQSALSANEAHNFKLSWEHQDWQRYMRTYMAGLQHQIFRQSVTANAADHDFQPWPRPAPYSSAASKHSKAL